VCHLEKRINMFEINLPHPEKMSRFGVEGVEFNA
jgi:hypothetical protein